uniref:Uncharacterized protein n=1 Tax=uncultured prokaryote TaxID=198431 RepID=A0A0H5Q795_9ZZZZ|nr:hypothetical protein [uncultured prokaryote]
MTTRPHKQQIVLIGVQRVAARLDLIVRMEVEQERRRWQPTGPLMHLYLPAEFTLNEHVMAVRELAEMKRADEIHNVFNAALEDQGLW